MGIFRELRARLKTGRQRKRLQEEFRQYHAVFESRCLSIPSDEQIRRRVGSRFSNTLARTKGHLNLLAIYHSYNWEDPSLSPSLKAFGSVRYLDWGNPSLANGLPRSNKDWRGRMNEGLLQTVRKWHAERPFDAIFTYLSGEQVIAETLVELRRLGAPMVNLCLNDKEAFVGKVRTGTATGMRDLCRHFDLCWTSTYDALEKYVVEDGIPLYLPEGANPQVHRAYEDEKKVFDVSFVGQCYGNRPAVISRLREAGIRVDAFGPGWPSGPLTTEEMVRTWSRSRINLGFGGVLGHEDTYCLKGRDFEIPMSGGLYLTEHHEELVPFYEIGREIVTYADFRDLLQKIQWLLSSPEDADAIRRAGQARALLDHSWEKRFDRVFRVMGVLA